jgi:hypothetical protein
VIDTERLIRTAIDESRCDRYAPETCKTNWGEKHVGKWCRGCLLWFLVCEYRQLEKQAVAKDERRLLRDDDPRVRGAGEPE